VVASLLNDQRTDVNKKNKSGFNALMMAIVTSREKILKMLLNHPNTNTKEKILCGTAYFDNSFLYACHCGTVCGKVCDAACDTVMRCVVRYVMQPVIRYVMLCVVRCAMRPVMRP